MLGDPVLDGCPVDLILYLAIPENAIQGEDQRYLRQLSDLLFIACKVLRNFAILRQ